MSKLSKLFLSVLGATLLTTGHAHAQIASPRVVIVEVNGQTVYRGTGAYDQIDYDGRSRDYDFRQNPNGTVSVSSQDGVTDLLINIDGAWFAGEQQWYAIEDLTVATTSGQTINGSPNSYSQVDYPGNSRNYRFVRNSDVSVSVTKPGGGIDRLTNIDGFWFSGEQRWYPIGDLVEAFNGNQTITGGSGYDQIDYPGDSSEYNFRRNANGSVRVTKPGGGVDTLIDIDGFWFQGEEEWYPIESLLAQQNRTIVGTRNYDQIDYDGFRSQYTFVQNQNGTVTVNRPGGLIDRLTSIDGFWFRGEEAWYSIEDIFDDNTGDVVDGIITGSNDVNDNLVGDNRNNVFFSGRGNDLIRGLGGTDTLRIDGDTFEWTYSQDGDSLRMSHPTWGVNTLIEMERLFSLRSGRAFTIAQAIDSTRGLPVFRIDGDNVVNGTPGNDVMDTQANVQGFYGGLGNDTYRGTANFEQVNYDGARSEFTITRNNNGSVRVRHPIWGTDTLINIDALIFTGVEPGADGARTAEFEFINVSDLF